MGEINDEYIYNKYINKHKKVICSSDKEYLSKRFENCCEEEALYRILHNLIADKPVCPICGKYVKWIGSPKYYTHTCGDNNCVKQYSVLKYKETCIRKYGVDNVSKLDTTKQKLAETNLSKYGYISPLQNESIKQKTKLTNIERYNNECAQSSDVVKEKIKQSNEKTCLDKYGVTNVAKLLSTNNKRINTCLQRYGSGAVINVNKINETKRNNNTFNTSTIEKQSYNLLVEKYPDIIQQYNSKLYPFNCDFYIPSLDLYIECNYHWTHGGHKYNENDIQDKQQLNKWINKGTLFYKNAIQTWTIRDVKKRQIAKQNKLNYLEFYNLQELINWININEQIQK